MALHFPRISEGTKSLVWNTPPKNDWQIIRDLYISPLRRCQVPVNLVRTSPISLGLLI